MIRPARSIAEDVWRDANRSAQRAKQQGKDFKFADPHPEASIHDPIAVIAAAIEAVRAEPCQCRCPDCSPHPHGTTTERPADGEPPERSIK